MGTPSRRAYDTSGPLCPRPACTDPAQGLAVGMSSLLGLESCYSHTRELTLSCPFLGGIEVSPPGLWHGNIRLWRGRPLGNPRPFSRLVKSTSGPCEFALRWPGLGVSL